MKMSSRIVLIGFIVSALSISAFGQVSKIDIDALIEETQKSGSDKNELTIVWWIPTEFWRAALAEEKLSNAQIEEFIGIVRPYTVVAIVDGKIATDGKVTFRTLSAVEADTRILGLGKTEHRALPSDKIGPGMATVLKIMRPIISNMLGSIGSNIHFIVFPGTEPGGGQIVDAARTGTFTVRLDANRTFAWRLPLAALTARKVCPVDGEKHPGNWKYCPFHGVELKNQ
jgi:hypothetical protein